MCIGIKQGIGTTKANKRKTCVYIFGAAFTWNSNRYKADNSQGGVAIK